MELYFFIYIHQNPTKLKKIANRLKNNVTSVEKKYFADFEVLLESKQIRLQKFKQKELENR